MKLYTLFFPPANVLYTSLPFTRGSLKRFGFSDSHVIAQPCHTRCCCSFCFCTTCIWVQMPTWQPAAFHAFISVECTHGRVTFATGSKTKQVSLAKLTKEHNYSLNMYLVATLQWQWMPSFLKVKKKKDKLTDLW